MEKAFILENIEYGKNNPVIKVLLNTTSVKEVRIVFSKGQEMKKHQADYPIVVEIVEGSIDFGVKDERHILSKGMLIALEEAIPHDLVARENSIVRLSLHKDDDVKRVQQVINN